MKRIFWFIMILAAVFALASCNKKKSEEKSEFEEQVSQEISAEDGGKVKSSDGNTSIEIPAGALESDTTITMRIFDAAGYAGTKDKAVVSKVVEFEPSGTVFKKPVMITMKSLENVGESVRAAKKKVVTAAVYRESKGEWSYSPVGAAVKVEYEASGDPIMTTAAGDPIMLNAAGDPIMQSDGSMLSAAGDPIMVTAAGDPIMNAAAGDPIMMTTGHFTAYAFFEIYVESETPEDDTDEVTDDDDDISDIDTDEDDPVNDGDTDTEEPEPEIQYSKVLCTNVTVCADDKGKHIICPEEGEEYYGQDAQYVARRSCVTHRSYTEIPKPATIENSFVELKDDVTDLTWLFTGEKTAYENFKNSCDISYGGKEDWRVPTVKELMTLAENGMLLDAGSVLDTVSFGLAADAGSCVYTAESYLYSFKYGDSIPYTEDQESFADTLVVCVSGKEYGKVSESAYVSVTENDEEIVFDSSTNLYWQKGSEQIESWKEALSYCEDLEYAGYSDWRLPNKNELLSIVDYSKAGSEVISSFPGITPGTFWSSTGYGSMVWVVDFVIFGPSIFPFEEQDAGEDIHYEYKSVKRDEIGEDDAGPFYAKCVRSYLDEKKDGVPDCDDTGIAPCKDAEGTVWSSVIYIDSDQSDVPIVNNYGDQGSGRPVDFEDAAKTCNSLNENGLKGKWRLPTVDEIRGIATTEKLKKGGSCGVTNECFEESCFEEEKCTGDKPSKTLLFDYGTMFSGTVSVDSLGGGDYGDPKLWALSVRYGAIGSFSWIPAEELSQRCVYDETIQYAETPYTDPETGYMWSDISSGYKGLNAAEEYCAALSADDPEHWWRIPTKDEIRTIIINCSAEDAPCQFDVNGKYSLFRDADYMWARDNEGVYYIDFVFADFYETNDSDANRVRCVVNGTDPCDSDPCAGIENATGTCKSVMPQSYSCECEEGYDWNGDKCEGRL